MNTFEFSYLVADLCNWICERMHLHVSSSLRLSLRLGADGRRDALGAHAGFGRRRRTLIRKSGPIALLFRTPGLKSRSVGRGSQQLRQRAGVHVSIFRGRNASCLRARDKKFSLLWLAKTFPLPGWIFSLSGMYYKLASDMLDKKVKNSGICIFYTFDNSTLNLI